MPKKLFRKIKVTEDICARLIQRKEEAGLHVSLEKYIEQILDVVSRK